jgi:8-hydroxy-5-deazaflavin:NADPH oxidoreductase
MRIAIIGGTGKEGRALALRWAKARHAIYVGSRDAERARAAAGELASLSGGEISGGANDWAVRESELAVLSVPYAAHAATLQALKAELTGKCLVDISVPLSPPKIRQVTLPEGRSAALEAQALLGRQTPVVATLHHVSAVHLSDLEHASECDVLACSDHPQALELVLGLIADLGMRGFDAGPLVNSIALESLTPVLLHLNKRYRSAGVGIRLTGIA